MLWEERKVFSPGKQGKLNQNSCRYLSLNGFWKHRSALPYTMTLSVIMIHSQSHNINCRLQGKISLFIKVTSKHKSKGLVWCFFKNPSNKKKHLVFFYYSFRWCLKKKESGIEFPIKKEIWQNKVLIESFDSCIKLLNQLLLLRKNFFYSS